MNNKFEKALPVALSIFGSIGVVGTSILSAKNSKNYSTDENDTKKIRQQNF